MLDLLLFAHAVSHLSAVPFTTPEVNRLLHAILVFSGIVISQRGRPYVYHFPAYWHLTYHEFFQILTY